MMQMTQNAPKVARSRICGIEVIRMTSRPRTSVTIPRVPGTISYAIADGGRLELGLVRVLELRRQQLVVLEEALGHLHGVGDRTGGDDHRDHQHQRVEGDPRPAGEAEAPDRRGDGGGEGDQHPVEPAEVGEQEAEGGEHREPHEHADLEGVLENPAGQDGSAGDVDLVPLVLLDRLDPLHVVEDGLVDLAAGEPVGVEVGHDERALLVPAHQAAEDVGRVLAHHVADLVGVLLGLWRLLDQYVGDDGAVRLDGHHAGAAVVEGLDPVVVHRIGRIGAVQSLHQLSG